VPFHPALILRRLAAAFALIATGGLAAHAEGIAGDFDFYVLALSWSPTYCLTSDDPDPAQCDTAPDGFVVHGLWPQYETGYPEYCSSREPRGIDDETLDAIADVMPSAGLAHYQWRKHGMCSGLDAASYFRLLLEAVEEIDIPPELADPDTDQRLRPDDIEADFSDANPGLAEDGMSIQCRQGRLTEVRICLTRDLQFRDCFEVDDDTCRSRTIAVPTAQ